MGLTTHAIARKAHIHPNQGVPIFFETTDVDEYFGALAENNAGFAPGTYLTLLKNDIRGTARCITAEVTGGADTPASTFELRGINQFGEAVSEDFAISATGTFNSNHAYKKLTAIKVKVQGASTRTIAFGLQHTANDYGIGLPVRIVNTSEAIGVNNNVGVPLAGAFNVRYQTFKGTDAATPGPMWIDFDLANVGKRP